MINTTPNPLSALLQSYSPSNTSRANMPFPQARTTTQPSTSPQIGTRELVLLLLKAFVDLKEEVSASKTPDSSATTAPLVPPTGDDIHPNSPNFELTAKQQAATAKQQAGTTQQPKTAAATAPTLPPLANQETAQATDQVKVKRKKKENRNPNVNDIRKKYENAKDQFARSGKPEDWAAVAKAEVEYAKKAEEGNYEDWNKYQENTA